MLPGVAHQQHAILRREALEKVVHLLVLARLDSSKTNRRCWDRSVAWFWSKNFCNVLALIPASSIRWAAQVGANPSTA